MFENLFVYSHAAEEVARGHNHILLLFFLETPEYPIDSWTNDQPPMICHPPGALSA
jgi:hypothetical protein